MSSRFLSACAVGAAIAFLPCPTAAQPKVNRLTLAQLLAKAGNNPLAKAARAETTAAQAKAAEARGARFGSISLTSFLAPGPDIECIDATCTETTNKDVSFALGGIYAGVRGTFTLPVFTFGKLSTISDAAAKAITVSRAREGTVAGQATVEISKVYYGLKLARELRWMLEDGREQVANAMKKLNAHLKAGTGGVTVQDKLRLDTLLAEVDSRLVDAKAAEMTALAAIRIAVNDDAVDIDDGTLDASKFNLRADPAHYLARAQQHHPQLDEARAGFEAVKALEEFESRTWLPDLAVAAGFNYAVAPEIQNAPSAFYNDPYNTLGAGVSLVMRWQVEPMIARARIRHARANTRRAAALLDGAVLLTKLGVRQAHAKATQAKARLGVVKRGEKAARGWVASVLQAEAIGVISAKDTADAYVSYFTARARVLQSLYEWNLSIVRLRHVIGEFATRPQRPPK